MPRGTILVVDDELEIREGLEALLTSEGFDVTPAETGEIGLQRLEDRPFDHIEPGCTRDRRFLRVSAEPGQHAGENDCSREASPSFLLPSRRTEFRATTALATWSTFRAKSRLRL